MLRQAYSLEQLGLVPAVRPVEDEQAEVGFHRSWRKESARPLSVAALSEGTAFWPILAGRCRWFAR